MKPIEFEGVNVVYGANQPEYIPLPGQRRGECGELLTCWQLTPDEIKKIQETGKLWLSILTFGQPLQPVRLSVDKIENPE